MPERSSAKNWSRTLTGGEERRQAEGLKRPATSRSCLRNDKEEGTSEGEQGGMENGKKVLTSASDPGATHFTRSYPKRGWSSS